MPSDVTNLLPCLTMSHTNYSKSNLTLAVLEKMHDVLGARGFTIYDLHGDAWLRWVTLLKYLISF